MSTLMRRDLLRSYGSELLPRYTSYPTAPHFSPQVDRDLYQAWLASISPRETASLYLHVPFCRSMCWYCGCHTSVVKREEPVKAYAAALRCEIDLVTAQMNHRLKVGHIHFGGGTPTMMSPELITDLVGWLRHSFFVLPDAAIAIEIDPRTLTSAMAKALGYCGVTRASLGVQSFDPAVQQAINRRQSLAETASATERLRKEGITSVNFDLIYGLPHQTVEACVDTVRRCVDLSPDRFSAFGYAHVPSFKTHQRRISELSLPDGGERHRQSEAIANALQEAGYIRVGLDHFALPGDGLAEAQRNGRLRRNFQGYTTDPGSILLGLGASSIGHLKQGYVQNEVGVRAYIESIASGMLATRKGCALGPDDRLRGEIIERIMCDFKADIDQICTRYGRQPSSVLQSSGRLAALVSDGIARIEGNSISVADDSRFLVRNVAAAFDTYLDQSAKQHSRAV
jgi:oxygen-independent coproporphyrinogen-3 oxidase